MEVKNGTTVHRIWKTLPDAELRAVFQYESEAKTFCRAIIEEQPEGCFLVCVDHYSGAMSCFHKAADQEAARL